MLTLFAMLGPVRMELQNSSTESGKIIFTVMFRKVANIRIIILRHDLKLL